MSLHLEPDNLVDAYEMLRKTLPFRRWRLPHSDTLEFRILTTKERCGHFREAENGIHEIAISASRVKDLIELLKVMGHEMVHLRQAILKHRDNHGASFERLGKSVCRRHDFDWETFK